MADTSAPATVAVATQSAWASKINWGEALKVIAMLLAMKGIDLDATTQAAILSAIIGIGAVYTWVIRTWFTKTVTPSSVANATVSPTATTAVRIS